MTLRQPIVAGRFYPEGAGACRAAIAECRAHAVANADTLTAPIGGIVPHAGWMCSGRVAVAVFDALARQCKPSVVILFGAVHRWPGVGGAVYAAGAWKTPLGEIPIASDLAAKLIARCPDLVDSVAAHRDEHSLEVQVPFIQLAFPDAALVPILVPPGPAAVGIGTQVGAQIADEGIDAIVVGTTDLTHYGPSYGFSPQGVGEDGIRWARDVNDRRVIERMVAFDAEGVLREGQAHRNACGTGAVAATLTAAIGLGATQAQELEHTTSHDVLGRGGQDSVGYVGIILGR